VPENGVRRGTQAAEPYLLVERRDVTAPISPGLGCCCCSGGSLVRGVALLLLLRRGGVGPADDWGWTVAMRRQLGRCARASLAALQRQGHAECRRGRQQRTGAAGERGGMEEAVWSRGEGRGSGVRDGKG
jgi:hypothetical protein